MTSSYTIEYNKSDRFVYDKEICPYLPPRIFDAHAHLQIPKYNPDLPEAMPLTKDPLFNTIDLRRMKVWWRTLFPDVAVRGLLLGTPTRGADIKGMNQYLANEIKETENCFSLLTGPQLSAEELEGQILRFGPQGLKPYMCFSQLDNFNQSAICDMIPEEQIALADKYRLAITLHVAKPRGMADAENLREINRLVRDYPDCNFILAHCGRCFITPNMEDALESLAVAENLWIDTSAVCDIGVFVNLFSKYDKKKILFGTDLVTATGFRGTYVRMGMTWEWCQANVVRRPGGQNVQATFAAYENLCALFHAAKFCHLSKNDIDDIFYKNSARVFNL